MLLINGELRNDHFGNDHFATAKLMYSIPKSKFLLTFDRVIL